MHSATRKTRSPDAPDPNAPHAKQSPALNPTGKLVSAQGPQSHMALIVVLDEKRADKTAFVQLQAHLRDHLGFSPDSIRIVTPYSNLEEGTKEDHEIVHEKLTTTNVKKAMAELVRFSRAHANAEIWFAILGAGCAHPSEEHEHYVSLDAIPHFLTEADIYNDLLRRLPEDASVLLMVQGDGSFFTDLPLVWRPSERTWKRIVGHRSGLSATGESRDPRSARVVSLCFHDAGVAEDEVGFSSSGMRAAIDSLQSCDSASLDAVVDRIGCFGQLSATHALKTSKPISRSLGIRAASSVAIRQQAIAPYHSSSGSGSEGSAGGHIAASSSISKKPSTQGIASSASKESVSSFQTNPKDRRWLARMFGK